MRKVAVVILLVAVVGVGSAEAGRLRTTATATGANSSESDIVHHTIHNTDAGYNFGPSPMVDLYVFTDGQELRRDGEIAENMDSKIIYITGRDLTGPTPTDISQQIGVYFSENNMQGKKVNAKLTQRISDGSGGYTYTDITDYNSWNMHESGQLIVITVSNTINDGGTLYPSHKLEVSFSYNNECDFDNDGNINLIDFSILAKDYGKPIGNYLADTTGPAGASDGFVDLYDLLEFMSEWLE